MTDSRGRNGVKDVVVDVVVVAVRGNLRTKSRTARAGRGADVDPVTTFFTSRL